MRTTKIVPPRPYFVIFGRDTPRVVGYFYKTKSNQRSNAFIF